MMCFENEMTNMQKIKCCQRIVNEIQKKSKRPVCRLTFSQEPFSITDSHLGGIPYLPQDQEYPMGADGQVLWLCAQINFAQMPQMKGFPDTGILQFYLSDWHYDAGFGLYSEDVVAIDQRQWRVLYHPVIDKAVTEEMCQAKMPVLWEDALELWRTPEKPLKMGFLPVQQESVSDTDYRFDTLFADELSICLPNADAEEYMPYSLYGNTSEEQESLAKLREQIKNGGCKMGGYPCYMQDDPRLYSDMCSKPLKEWDTLLFQLDDDTFTFPAGDVGEMDFDLNGGTLNFLIRSEDLIKRDFSQVLAQWSCT